LLLRRLSPDEFSSEAKPALDACFDDPIGREPFSSHVPARLILETPLRGFWLDEDQFQAVCFAAERCGDRSMYFSWARGYLGGTELLPYHTSEIGLDWAAYDAADDQPIDREHDIGIPLDRLLYSPSGQWCVQTPDIYAAVAGSTEFLQEFKVRYPDWENSLRRFLEGCSEATERGVDMSWARTLLRHVYGDNPPQF
jgi:hypothetical protein